jgi:hypothetical protein
MESIGFMSRKFKYRYFSKISSTPLKMMKILLFFESNKFRQFFSFSIKIVINSCYSWKNSSFWRIFHFSDEFPLLPVIKTIHSAFTLRGNLPWKTDKIVIKWGDFYLEVLLIPFEMTKIYHKYRVKISFFKKMEKNYPEN